MSKGQLFSATLALIVAGCGTTPPTAPRIDREEAGAFQTFLIANSVDPRLPRAGAEALSVTDEDRALAALDQVDVADVFDLVEAGAQLFQGHSFAQGRTTVPSARRSSAI